MFTHTFNREEKTAQGTRYYFDFTNGTDTYTDACIPQDANGLKFWIKSRLEQYNTETQLKTELVVGNGIDLTDPVVVPPVLTPAEIAQNTWLTKYHQWVRIKTTVVDTGIVPITNPKIEAMLNDLKATLLPSYIDFI